MHGRHHAFEHGVEELPGLFRIAIGQEFHGAFEVRKQHGDLLALAFEGAAGGQNFLCQIGRGVRQWSLLGWSRGRRSGWGGGITSPDQHFPILIHRHLFHLNQLHLEVFQVVVLQGKLALHGPVRDPLVLLEPGDDLVHDLFEGHGAPSTCGCAPRCFRPPVHSTIHAAVALWYAGTPSFSAFQAALERVIHFAAFRIRTRGLSITVAVRYRLKIQTFAARYVWEMAWRETVLIGNLPTSLLPLSRHAFRPGIWSTAFCESGDFAARYNSRKRQRRTWQEASITEGIL